MLDEPSQARLLVEVLRGIFVYSRHYTSTVYDPYYFTPHVPSRNVSDNADSHIAGRRAQSNAVSAEDYVARGYQYHSGASQAELLQIIRARLLMEGAHSQHGRPVTSATDTALAHATMELSELSGDLPAPQTPPHQLRHSVATPSTQESYLSTTKLPGKISALTYLPRGLPDPSSKNAMMDPMTSAEKIPVSDESGYAGTTTIGEKMSVLTSLLNITEMNMKEDDAGETAPDDIDPMEYPLGLLNHVPAQSTAAFLHGPATKQPQDSSKAQKPKSSTEYTDALLRRLNIVDPTANSTSNTTGDVSASNDATRKEEGE